MRQLRFPLSMLGIVGLTLAVRLWHLWSIHTAPYFLLKLGDAESYDAWARRIAAGDWLGSEIFYQAPLYPYFLGFVYTVLGDGPFPFRLVQAALGAASCVLLAVATRRIFSSNAVGMVAGLLLALYAPAIFFDGLTQKSVLDLFLLSLALWLMSNLDTRDDVGSGNLVVRWAALGATVGCLVLTRENAIVFSAVILPWSLLHGRRSGRWGLAPAGLFLLGVAVVLLPVGLRNRIVGGEFHLTTSQFGTNFFIGNNESATGSYVPLLPGRGEARYERQDATELAERSLGRSLTPAEVSSYWTGRALEYIRSNPADWLRLMGRKLALVSNATETEDTEDQYTHAERSLPLRLTGTVFHFGLIAPLAVFGLCVTWSRRSRLWPFYLMIASYTASVVMFYVLSRYRLPLVPLLIPFAAAGLTVGPRWIRTHPRAGVFAAAAVTLIAFAACNWPLLSKDTMRATTRYNIARILLERGEVDEAIAQYRVALEHDSGLPHVHYNLANALAGRGELDEAIERFRDAVRIKPDYAKAHNNLGIVLAMKGRAEEAMLYYRRALQIEPDYAIAHYNLGKALHLQGDLDAAVEHYQAALRIDPGYAEARNNLNMALRARETPLQHRSNPSRSQ